MLLAEQAVGLEFPDIRWQNIIQLPIHFVLIDLDFACELGHVAFTPLDALLACSRTVICSLHTL